MKYKTLFRVMMKVLGVYLTLTGFTSLFSAIGSIVRFSNISGPSNIYTPGYMAFVVFTPAMQLLLGVYLFFGGKWIADLAIPGNRPYCHQCGYDLTGAVGDICNECGTPFRGKMTATHE